MARKLFELKKIPQCDNRITPFVKIIEESNLPALESAVNAFLQGLAADDTFLGFYIQKTNYDNYVPRTGVNAVHICVIEYVTIS